MATEPVEGDIAVEGLKLAGPGWEDALKELLGSLSYSSTRACLFAVRIRRPSRRFRCRPRPPPTAAAPYRSEFLSHGQMTPQFHRSSTSTRARRGAARRARKLGAVEVRGGELRRC